MMFSLAAALDFPLDSPWNRLPEKVRHAILYGIEPQRIPILTPPDAKIKRGNWEGREIGFNGIARRIERYYRWYRQRGEANSRMEAWLDKVMVEQTCPDCKGARVRASRLLFTVAGRHVHDVGQMNFDELHAFLGTVKPVGRGADAGRQVLKEIRGRVSLLLGIGLDYLNFNRRSGSLSGGESQRIRLSTQIGSGLMGMLYVLDEPSIGLHPKDNVKMIATLERLRDIGNTVDRRRARRRHHPRRRLPRRDGPRAWRPRRPRGRAGHARRSAQVQGLADRAVPVGQALDRHARETPRRKQPLAGRPRGARAQPEIDRRGDSSRPADRHHRCVRIGQEHPRQRRALQGALEAARRHAHAARRARRRRRHGTRPQGGQHRSIADRTEQPLQPRHLRRLLRRGARPVHERPALDRARLPAGPIQLQRQGRALRGVPGRRRDHHAAVFHAGRRGDLRRVQGRAVQQRDARSDRPGQDHRRRARHVDRGGRALFRGRTPRFTARSRCWTSSGSAT